MRRAELVRLLERVPAFSHPRADLEQLATPAEAAASLLASADRWSGVDGASVVDLGCGTGRLAIGAAALGAREVYAVDVDPEALATAREAAGKAGVAVRFVEASVGAFDVPADIVLMNPPFGAQRRHADRPFWESAYRLARRSVHAFSLRASRTFIASQAVARRAHVLEVVPVPWGLAATLPHHRRRRVELEVDLWALRTVGDDGGPAAS